MSYEELDPEYRAPVGRTTQQANAEEQKRADITSLMELPTFHRFLLTVIEKARIHASDYRVQDTALAFEAGRRILGLEVLDAIRAVCPQLDLTLAVEKAQQQEIADGAGRRGRGPNSRHDR